MRLVLTKHLKDGDIIARDIISYEGAILIRHNTRFKESFKSKLIERNILKVYIDDEISKGIEPVPILDHSLRSIIAQDIKTEFYKLQNSLELDIERVTQITNFLLEELSGKEMILEIEDLKTNDYYTYEHCIAVAILTYLVCDKMSIGLQKKESIVTGALIHDIGKLIISKEYLNQSSRLAKREYNTAKTHPEIGYRMIKDNRAIHTITKHIVLCHHEREDGSGYPFGKGKELHIGAKIVGACDVYHNLISEKCYGQGLSISEVFDIVKKEPINPEISKIIENSFAYYRVGEMVCLNDGSIGIVEKNSSADLKKPIVRIFSQQDGEVRGSYQVDLHKESKYDIIGRYEGNIE